MAYKYDIFISYRRDEGSETLAWIKQHFYPILSLRVGQELDAGKVAIFLDEEQIESGSSWPHNLGVKLGQSRILVPLWSKNYFNSPWCVLELSHMLAREKSLGMRTAANPFGLIVPAIIHDGKEFPQVISHIQKFNIQRCFNVRIAKYGSRAEELDDILTIQAKALARAIDAAPKWKKSWSFKAADTFYKTLFRGSAPSQTTRPRYTK